jgi:4'-phosphopantetheinyl transferase EntD
MEAFVPRIHRSAPVQAPERSDIVSLFETAVRAATAPCRAGKDVLFEPEWQHVREAHPARQRDFATGRLLARSLLAQMGVAPTPIAVGPNGEPCWPSEFAGSVSHSNGYCAVAVARQADATSLGLDIEPALPLEPTLLTTVCVERELRWLRSMPPSERHLLARLVFSAKECVYKCQYPVTRMHLEFEDLEVQLDHPGSGFTARFRRDVGPAFSCGSHLNGNFALSKSWIVTGATI